MNRWDMSQPKYKKHNDKDKNSKSDYKDKNHYYKLYKR